MDFDVATDRRTALVCRRSAFGLSSRTALQAALDRFESREPCAPLRSGFGTARGVLARKRIPADFLTGRTNRRPRFVGRRAGIESMCRFANMLRDRKRVSLQRTTLCSTDGEPWALEHRTPVLVRGLVASVVTCRVLATDPETSVRTLIGTIASAHGDLSRWRCLCSERQKPGR